MRETFKYQPENPFADQFGFVTAEDFYTYKYISEPDKSATIGNQKITIHYISDNMDATWHPSNGQYYTSKKKFRNETKARGCIEVGDQIKTKPRKKIELSKRQRREDIKKAIYDLKNGHNTFKGTEHENVFKRA